MNNCLVHRLLNRIGKTVSFDIVNDYNVSFAYGKHLVFDFIPSCALSYKRQLHEIMPVEEGHIVSRSRGVDYLEGEELFG